MVYVIFSYVPELRRKKKNQMYILWFFTRSIISFFHFSVWVIYIILLYLCVFIFYVCISLICIYKNILQTKCCLFWHIMLYLWRIVHTLIVILILTSLNFWDPYVIRSDPYPTNFVFYSLSKLSKEVTVIVFTSN